MDSKIILPFLVLWLSFSCHSPDRPQVSGHLIDKLNDSITVECRSAELKFSIASIMPRDESFSDTTSWFSDGYFRIQSLKGGEYIAYGCGGMLGLPILDMSQKIATDSISQGRTYNSVSGFGLDSTFWREDHYPYVALSVLYENVPKGRKQGYERILDEIKDKMLKRE